MQTNAEYNTNIGGRDALEGRGGPPANGPPAAVEPEPELTLGTLAESAEGS